jgi:uncharacterized protein YjiS (DUF1127 family)
MYSWYLVHSDFRSVLDQDRAEFVSRAGYLAVVGIEQAVSSTVRATAGGLRHLAAAYDRWQRRRATTLALSRLDPRLLRDVGIDPHRFAFESDEVVEESLDADEATWPVAERQPDVPLLQLDLDCPEARAERRLVA